MYRIWNTYLKPVSSYHLDNAWAGPTDWLTCAKQSQLFQGTAQNIELSTKILCQEQFCTATLIRCKYSVKTSDAVFGISKVFLTEYLTNNQARIKLHVLCSLILHLHILHHQSGAAIKGQKSFPYWRLHKAYNLVLDLHYLFTSLRTCLTLKCFLCRVLKDCDWKLMGQQIAVVIFYSLHLIRTI